MPNPKRYCSRARTSPRASLPGSAPAQRRARAHGADRCAPAPGAACCRAYGQAPRIVVAEPPARLSLFGRLGGQPHSAASDRAARARVYGWRARAAAALARRGAGAEAAFAHYRLLAVQQAERARRGTPRSLPAAADCSCAISICWRRPQRWTLRSPSGCRDGCRAARGARRRTRRTPGAGNADAGGARGGARLLRLLSRRTRPSHRRSWRWRAGWPHRRRRRSPGRRRAPRSSALSRGATAGFRRWRSPGGGWTRRVRRR